jgi:AcrR family transcriptional regulator
MPKLIDAHRRKQLIAEAAWRIIAKEGIAGASVRNIAKEAGLSLGSLRYYFETQEELLGYAHALVTERITQRVDEIFTDDKNPKEKILRVLLELIPACGNIRLETEARLVFKAYSLREKKSKSVGQDGVFLAAKSVMSNLVLLNLLKKELDVNMETERLYAFMDGLALDSLLREEYSTCEQAEKVIRYHLRSICKEEI